MSDTMKPNLDVADIIQIIAGHAARVVGYTPEKQQASARRVALMLIERRPGAVLADVMNECGLCEENATRALRQLVAQGAIRLRSTGGYEVAAKAS